MATPERFKKAITAFIDAGNKLVEAWDEDGWNADDAFGQPVDAQGEPLFPLSLDDWMLELSGFYNDERVG